MKILILWSRPSGYLAASVNALAARGHHVHLVVVRQGPATSFTFETFLDSSIELTTWDPKSYDALDLEPVRPDLVLLSGWTWMPYLKFVVKFRRSFVTVLTFDNQWQNSTRQRTLVRLRPLMQKVFDAAFVPGPRQALYAKKLGFPPQSIHEGSYSCDYQLFSQQPRQTRQRTLLFCGRLTEVKGVDTLIQAYANHRAETRNPLDLHVSGVGSLASRLVAVPGVHYLGFQQPRVLAESMARSYGLVLPSEHEPWGVVIHEAAASGLPLICTSQCGATDYFLKTTNGFLVSPGSVEELTKAIGRLAQLDSQEWSEMSRASRRLASTVTPESWADTIEGIAQSIRRSSNM